MKKEKQCFFFFRRIISGGGGGGGGGAGAGPYVLSTRQTPLKDAGVVLLRPESTANGTTPTSLAVGFQLSIAIR